VCPDDLQYYAGYVILQLLPSKALSMPVPRSETSPPATNGAVSADARLRGDPAFADFRLEHSPLYLLVRAAGRYSLDMGTALKASGMDLLSWRALMTLNEESPRSVSEIAERSVTRLSTMTRVVQRLEKKNLVRLSRRTSDARVTEVRLTPRGTQALESVRGVASRIYNQAVGQLSAAQIETLNALMRQIFVNLPDQPDRA
jgi:MarR family transcriptional regulator, organic hydroperoxide resistance regulator